MRKFLRLVDDRRGRVTKGRVYEAIGATLKSEPVITDNHGRDFHPCLRSDLPKQYWKEVTEDTTPEGMPKEIYIRRTCKGNKVFTVGKVYKAQHTHLRVYVAKDDNGRFSTIFGSPIIDGKSDVWRQVNEEDYLSQKYTSPGGLTATEVLKQQQKHLGTIWIRRKLKGPDVNVGQLYEVHRDNGLHYVVGDTGKLLGITMGTVNKGLSEAWELYKGPDECPEVFTEELYMKAQSQWMGIPRRAGKSYMQLSKDFLTNEEESKMAVRIEKVTLLNGIRSDEHTESQILNMIEKEQKAIERISKLGVESEHINGLKEEHAQNIAELVAVLPDARSE